MKRLVIFLIIICIAGIPFLDSAYAGSAAVAEKGAVSGDNQTAASKSDKTIQKKQEAAGAEFSGYPKSYVVPKGVCETNEPVMKIGK